MTSPMAPWGQPSEPDTREYYYRYEGYFEGSGGYDIMGEYVPDVGSSHPKIRCHQYEVLKHTAKGVWINLYGYTDKPNVSNARFVNASWNKRFCLPTKKEALESFIKRKERELAIHIARANDARKFKELALIEQPKVAHL